MFMEKVKDQGHRGHRGQNKFYPNWAFPDFKFTDGYEIMHTILICIQEEPYCFGGHPSEMVDPAGRVHNLW